MLARILTSVIAVFLCASAYGQSRQERGKKLIDDVVAALGGERFLKMKDRVESGRAYSFFREELSGLSLATVYTRYIESPAPGTVGIMERQAFGKEEKFGAALFLPDKGYEVTFRGARPYPEERFERWRDSTLLNILYILRMRLKEPGLTFDAEGSDILDNLPVEIVNVTDSENRTVKVWIDQNTKLPVRQVYYRRDPKTKQRFEEVTIFSKYRDVGEGVQWPFNLQRLRDGEQVFQMYADSVQINQSLKDDLFTLSPKTKILKALK